MENRRKRVIDKTEIIICDKKDLDYSRLDKFLFAKYPDYSRSYFQELINQKLISVNDNNKIKSSHKVKENDKIEINFPKISQYDVTPQNIDFDIIDIQPDFIVVNKPAGLVVHPSENNKNELSLVHGLLYKFKEFADFNDNQRPGIVHRIDRGTSGLLLVAKINELDAMVCNYDIDALLLKVKDKSFTAVVKQVIFADVRIAKIVNNLLSKPEYQIVKDNLIKRMGLIFSNSKMVHEYWSTIEYVLENLFPLFKKEIKDFGNSLNVNSSLSDLLVSLVAK